MVEITNLLVFGGLAFWIFFFILSVIIFIGIEADCYKFAVFSTILFLLSTAGSWLPNLTVGKVAVFTILYFLTGGVWSIFKWYLFIKEKAQAFYSKNNKPTQSQTDAMKEDLCPSIHKERIFSWITFWIWSVVWTLTHDAVKSVFDLLRGIYQKIVDKAIVK